MSGECQICLCDEEGALWGHLDGCTHGFHFDCIRAWSNRENSCPVCRSRFRVIIKARTHERPACINEDAATLVKVKAKDQEYNFNPQDYRLAEPNQDDDDAEDEDEDDQCEICHRSTDPHLMLLCDSCDRGFHTMCLGRGRRVPNGSWYCEDCCGVKGGSDRLQHAAAAGPATAPNAAPAPAPTAQNIRRALRNLIPGAGGDGDEEDEEEEEEEQAVRRRRRRPYRYRPTTDVVLIINQDESEEEEEEEGAGWDFVDDDDTRAFRRKRTRVEFDPTSKSDKVKVSKKLAGSGGAGAAGRGTAVVSQPPPLRVIETSRRRWNDLRSGKVTFDDLFSPQVQGGGKVSRAAGSVPAQGQGFYKPLPTQPVVREPTEAVIQKAKELRAAGLLGGGGAGPSTSGRPAVASRPPPSTISKDPRNPFLGLDPLAASHKRSAPTSLSSLLGIPSTSIGGGLSTAPSKLPPPPQPKPKPAAPPPPRPQQARAPLPHAGVPAPDNNAKKVLSAKDLLNSVPTHNKPSFSPEAHQRLLAAIKEGCSEITKELLRAPYQRGEIKRENYAEVARSITHAVYGRLKTLPPSTLEEQFGDAAGVRAALNRRERPAFEQALRNELDRARP